MPEADDAKTKSALKPRNELSDSGFSFPGLKSGLFGNRKYRKVLLYGLGVVFALLAVLAPSVFFQPPTATLQANGMTYKLAIANTETKRAQGLGSRTALENDQGMIFVFDKMVEECFWMKDMQFPIDIIWFNENKQIVHIERNVSPDSYPDTSYCPSQPAKYVIELAAGQAEKAELKLGQKLSF